MEQGRAALQSARRWARAVASLHERREPFGDSPPWLRASLFGSCLVYLAALTRLAPHDIPAVAGLTFLYALTVLVPPVPSPAGMVRVPRLAFTVTVALLWSPLQTMLGVAFGTLLAVLAFRLYEPERAILNTIFWAFPAALASWVGHVILMKTPDPLVGLGAASLAIVLVYWPVNYAGAALYSRLRWKTPFFRYWWSSVSEDPLAQVLSAVLPIFLGAIALGLGSHTWTVFLLTGVAALTMPSARTQIMLYFASQRTTQEIVRALMVALERVVPGAQAHAERISNLVAETGRRLRVPAATIELWRLAALLHDIGLIDAASRTAPPEIHAATGARILASYPDTIVAEMVRDHHTPWSRGPLPLHRKAALGARVLAAAECYDELRYGTSKTAGRATHAAAAEAFQPLIRTQVDPHIAAALLETAGRLSAAADA